LVPAGLRVAQPVGLIDLVPTLAALLGLPLDTRPQGIDLTPLWRGSPDEITAFQRRLTERTLFAEAWGGIRTLADGSVDHSWQPPGFGVRTTTAKLLLPRTAPPERATTMEAYDLAADPEERFDLFGDQSDRFSALAGQLRAYAKDGAIVAATGGGAPVPPPDAATAEKLRALGYVR
jgi:arylsulfatase A-like enzyme